MNTFGAIPGTLSELKQEKPLKEMLGENLSGNKRLAFNIKSENSIFYSISEEIIFEHFYECGVNRCFQFVI